MAHRITIAEAALITLGRTHNPGVGWGDSGLLHLICDDAGLPHRGWHTERLILQGLERRPDLWQKRYFEYRGRRVRAFYPTDKAKTLILQYSPEWNE